MRLSSVTERTAAKQALRDRMRQLRQSTPPEEKAALDAAMAQCFLHSTLYRRCQQLFCFVSLPEEPDTWAVLQTALADGKRVAVPRCLAAHQMQFFRLLPDLPLSAQLAPGTYGVWEPHKDLPLESPEKTAHPLCLVPGLAFDRTGGRLGYGAGYYDRFLAAHAELRTIGYGASKYMVDHVPMTSTDVRLDGVATENLLEVWHGEKRNES